MTLAAVSATLQSGADYYTPRTQPQNETGEPAVDLGSQNFNWGVSLVNLAGRSGLDLDISLSYNSLVWVKSANSADIKFNVDNGYPAPGFQFAFPILQRVTDAQGTRYMLILPSGARVELRSAGTNTYESADSTYIQLLVTGAATAEARLPNGLIFYFLEYPQNDLQCAAIKDRNGNYISINRDANINNKGRILGITDTLGRTVSFNYDGFGNLSSITQLRAGQTYTWASFDYGAAHTLQPQFSGGLIPTPAVNTNITVLRGVNVADGSSYKFLYTPWGQVWKIEHYAQDAHLLSSTAYNLPGSDLLAASPQPDCPRFTERQDRAANWNGGNPASTTYTFSNARTKVRLPDGTYLREYFATSADWKKGLTTLSELWTSDPEVASPTPVMLKATSFNYTQDDTTLTYPKNPRLQSANFSDDKGNYRMVEYSYTSFGLPNHIREYTGSPAVQRRHTEITYRLDAAYVNRRVIGLVNSRHVYEVNSGVETLVSKISYGYDAAVADTSAQPTQHDSDRAGNGYGVNYNTGRGNMTIAARWDVGDENNWNKTLRETWTYNITTARGVSCA